VCPRAGLDARSQISCTSRESTTVPQTPSPYPNHTVDDAIRAPSTGCSNFSECVTYVTVTALWATKQHCCTRKVYIPVTYRLH
jgi:hypothetical protein